MIKNLLVSFALAILSLSWGICAQQVSRATEIKRDSICSITLNFRFNRAVVDGGYMNNAVPLKELHKILTNKIILSGLDSIVVVASASPDGVLEHNIRLSNERAKAVKGYLIWKYPHLDQHKIYTHSIGENWNGLKELVEKDRNTPYRDEVLKLLEQDVNSGTKEWRIKQIGKGTAYEYITKNMLRYLRSSAAAIIFYQKQIEVESTPLEEEKIIIVEEPIEIEEPQQRVSEPVIVPIVVDATAEREHYFALKTNLLYDGFGVANIGAEIGIGSHFSFDLPFIYSPYTIRRDYKVRILALQPEFRYWLSEPLQGHFFGVQLGVGWFNIATDTKNRYQDNRPLYSFGISYGYSLSISKHWGAEFILGGGYANYGCDIFYNVENGALIDRKVYHYWGVTRAGINLIYKFNLNK